MRILIRQDRIIIRQSVCQHKIAKSGDLSIDLSDLKPQWFRLNGENGLHYASTHLARLTNIANSVLLATPILTLSTACHVLSAHARNLAQCAGKGHQQAAALTS